MRSIILFCASCLTLTFCVSSLSAAEPKAVALNAVATLFIEHDRAAFKSFVNDDAIQGDRDPGSAITKIDKQRPEKMKVIDIPQLHDVCRDAGIVSVPSLAYYTDGNVDRVLVGVRESDGIINDIATWLAEKSPVTKP